LLHFENTIVNCSKLYLFFSETRTTKTQLSAGSPESVASLSTEISGTAL